MLGGLADDEAAAAAFDGDGDDDSPTPNRRADDGRVSLGMGGGDTARLPTLKLIPPLPAVSLLFFTPELSPLGSLS